MDRLLQNCAHRAAQGVQDKLQVLRTLDPHMWVELKSFGPDILPVCMAQGAQHEGHTGRRLERTSLLPVCPLILIGMFWLGSVP